MEKTDVHRYDDIIDRPHHQSAVRPHMAAADRAAQFSPFAALTGHGDAIRETARRTEEKRVLSEEQAALLDDRLRLLQEALMEQPEVQLTWFLPDAKKAGGRYVVQTGRLRRIDPVSRVLVLTDRTEISLDDLYAIESPLFRQAARDD